MLLFAGFLAWYDVAHVNKLRRSMMNFGSSVLGIDVLPLPTVPSSRNLGRTTFWLAVAVIGIAFISLDIFERRLHGVGETSPIFLSVLVLAIVATAIALGGHLREILVTNARLESANRRLRTANVEQRRLAQERLVYLAFHDELTGLLNRARWQELLRERAERRTLGLRDAAFAVLFIDLDGFKDVNDGLGHARGDDVLIDAAKRLRQVLRPDDAIGRLGGDEFAVLLPDLGHLGEAAEVANRLLQTMRLPFVLSDQTFHLSASIGIALYPRDGSTAEALLHQSDAAVYVAKRDGGNCFRYYSLDESVARDRRLDLKHAIARAVAGNEFALHYQPLLDLRTGQIEAVEALIRWEDPVRGTMAPETFIRVAEEAGLMQPIGRWTLEAAASQSSAWSRASFTMPISANVSVNQLHDPRFYDHLRETLAEYGVAPRQMRLEVTESAAMADMAVATEVLSRCRALGMEIVLDDFGTHYSSLTYLQRLPIDTIKIDRSFVRDLPNNQHDAAIVRGVISLGHDLNRRIVAEGVESAEQLQWLRAAGCDVAQGFLIQRPMPPSHYAQPLALAI
jgi:diguanylate cyclase (GGDEF)-like protein